MQSVSEWKATRQQTTPKASGIDFSQINLKGIPLSKRITQGAKDIGREIIKLPLRMGASVADIGLSGAALLGSEKAAQGLKNVEAQGGYEAPFGIGKIRAIGDTGERVNIGGTQFPVSSLKDITGAGLEAASYLPIARLPSLGAQALKTSVPTAAKAFAKEGAIAGGIGGAGHEMQSPESTLGSTLKAGAIGTGLGTVLGAGIGAAAPVVGRGLQTLLRKGVEEAPKPMTVNEWKAAGKPKQTMEEYSKSQGYEPYISPENLPTIEMGTKPKATVPKKDEPLRIVPEKAPEQPSNLPVIEAGTKPIKIPPTPKVSRETPLPTLFQKTATPRATTPTRPSIVEVKPTEAANVPSPIQVRTPSPRQGAFKSRVYERLKTEHPELEGSVGYTPIKLKQEAEKAVNLIAKDKQEAFDIAMGKKVSDDITSTSVNIALAEKALDEGNISLFTRLVKNRSLAQTRRGQEIVSEKGSVNDNSTSRYVKDLIAMRLDKLGSKYLADIRDLGKKTGTKQRGTNRIEKEVGTLQKNIKERKISMADARELLDALACV